MTINNTTFYLSNTDGTYILDCKNKIIIDENGINASSIMSGDFPKLINGINNIDSNGAITSIKLTYRETYL